jgi:hypothetical protein
LPSWVSGRRQQKGRKKEKKEKEKVWIGKKIRKVLPPLSDKKTENFLVKSQPLPKDTVGMFDWILFDNSKRS